MESTVAQIKAVITGILKTTPWNRLAELVCRYIVTAGAGNDSEQAPDAPGANAVRDAIRDLLTRLNIVIELAAAVFEAGRVDSEEFQSAVRSAAKALRGERPACAPPVKRGKRRIATSAFAGKEIHPKVIVSEDGRSIVIHGRKFTFTRTIDWQIVDGLLMNLMNCTTGYPVPLTSRQYNSMSTECRSFLTLWAEWMPLSRKSTCKTHDDFIRFKRENL